MSRGYTDAEFAEKVDWEGGIFGALFGYGLTAEALDDQEGDLYKAVAALDAIRPQLDPLINKIEDLLEEALEE